MLRSPSSLKSFPPRLLLAVPFVLLAGGAGMLALAAPAAAVTSATTASDGEAISKYDIAMQVKTDGGMHVTETIDYDFGSNDRHGIERYLITKQDYTDPNKPDGPPLYREYPVSDIEVTSPSGAPADTDVSGGDSTVIRIGDPDKTVSGVQKYVIDYDIGAVVNTISEAAAASSGIGAHQELYWNAVGLQWGIPLNNVTVKLSGPAGITKVGCSQGRSGSTNPCQDTLTGGKATFRSSVLGPNEGLTIVAAFPSGTFPDFAPIIKERQTLARAFTLNPATGIGGLAVFGLLGGGAAALVSRRGRDEQYLGVTPGLEPGLGQEANTSRVGLFGREPIAVQFSPPEGVRVGQIGTLIDEQANVLDVTATIVDLAVRGFLKIEEIPKDGWLGKADWNLVMTWPAPTDELNSYEMTLLKAIFKDRQDVKLSELKQTFASDLSKVQKQLYADVTRNGWFRGNPSSVRVRWGVYAALLVAAGIGLTIVLALFTTLAIIGLGLVAAGLVAALVAPRMPARTAKGTAMLAQVRGFRTYLETAEANQIRFEEGEDIFSRYLPYAIIFGVAERWAGVFQQLAASGTDVAQPSWYYGSGYAQGALFNYALFAGSMDNFTTTTSGSIAAATPSSSGSSGFGGGGGGFSGGGGGGGGGGSW